MTGAKKLALSRESNSPIKLKLAEESLKQTGLKTPGGQERGGHWAPKQGEAL